MATDVEYGWACFETNNSSDTVETAPLRQLNPNLTTLLPKGHTGVRRFTAKDDYDSNVNASLSSLKSDLSALKHQLNKEVKRREQLSARLEEESRQREQVAARLEEESRQREQVAAQLQRLEGVHSREKALLAVRQTVNVWAGLAKVRLRYERWARTLQRKYDGLPKLYKDKVKGGFGGGSKFMDEVKAVMRDIQTKQTYSAEVIRNALTLGKALVSEIMKPGSELVRDIVKLATVAGTKKATRDDRIKWDNLKLEVLYVKLALAKEVIDEDDDESFDSTELLLLWRLVKDSNDVAHLSITEDVRKLVRKLLPQMLKTSGKTMATMFNDIPAQGGGEEEEW